MSEENNEASENSEAAGEGGDVEGATGFFFEIKKHDDEKEEHHHRSGVDENLDDPDEEGIESNKEGGQCEEAENETHSAIDWITKGHDASG